MIDKNKKLTYARMSIGSRDPALLMLLAKYPIVVSSSREKGDLIIGYEGFATDEMKIVLNPVTVESKDPDYIASILVHELLHILLGHFDSMIAAKVDEISGLKDKVEAQAFRNIVFDVVVNYYVGLYYKQIGVNADSFGIPDYNIEYKTVAKELIDSLKDRYVLDLNKDSDQKKFKDLLSSGKRLFSVGIDVIEDKIAVVSDRYIVFEWPAAVVLYPYTYRSCPKAGIGKSDREIIKSQASRGAGLVGNLLNRGAFDLDEKWDLVHLIKYLIGMNSLKFTRKIRLNREDRRGFIKKSKKLILSVFIAVDTSLSITDEEVRYFISMLKPLKNRCNLDIVFFSDDIWLRISGNEKVPEVMDIKSGGTLYRPVFKEAARKQYDVKIMATDGYPCDQDSLEMIKGDRTWVFALSDEKNIRLFDGFKVYKIKGLID